MINKSLEQLLFLLTEDKKYNWDSEENAMRFFLSNTSKLYAFEDSKGFNIDICLEVYKPSESKNSSVIYSVTVQRPEIVNFIKAISLAGEKNFELSCEREFPDAFKRASTLVTQILKGQPLENENRYEFSTDDNIINIVDKKFNCIHTLSVYYPDYEKYMGNFHIDCEFYLTGWASKTMSFKKIIPPESIEEYPFLNSILIPSKKEFSNEITDTQNFITKLKECNEVNINSIALMIDLEKTLLDKNKKRLKKI